MKQLLIALVAVLISVSSLAATKPSNLSSAKNLSAAWEKAKSMHLKIKQNDISMVYGGKDIIALKPTISSALTTA